MGASDATSSAILEKEKLLSKTRYSKWLLSMAQFKYQKPFCLTV